MSTPEPSTAPDPAVPDPAVSDPAVPDPAVRDPAASGAAVPGAVQAPGRPGRWWRSVARTVLALLLGAVVGVLGTVAHRAQWHDLPVGIVLALAITLSTAVLCRAWAGIGTLLAAGAGWVVAVQVLSVAGPGGDVLVPAQAVGLVWTYGGLAMFLAAAFLPRSWFVDSRG